MNPIQFNSTKPKRPSVSNRNFHIGTVGDYGPSNVSGFYTGLTPPIGQYAVYSGRTPQTTTVRVFPNDNELVSYLKLQGFRARKPEKEFAQLLQTASFTNNICVVNKDIEPFYIGSSLKFHFDAGFTPCFASSSEHIYTLNESISGELFPTDSSGSRYSEDNDGYVVFRESKTQYIETDLTAPVSFRSPFSLNFWVYLSGSQGADTRLFSKAPLSGNNEFEVGIDGNKVFVKVAGNTTTFDQIGDPTPNLNAWNLISITCNSNADGLSVNGSEFTLKTRIAPITNIQSTKPIILGSLGGVSNFFNGGIAVFNMHTETLKQPNVLQTYNAYARRFGLLPI